MKEQIERVLHPLIGLPLLRIFQVKFFTSFLFGIEYTKYDIENKDIQLRFKFNVYAHCPWRLRGPDGIVIGFGDRFYELGDDQKPSTVQGEVDQSRKFLITEKGMRLIRGRKDDPLKVNALHADEIGGFQLTFSDGYSLEFFPDSNIGLAAWGYENFDTSESGD